MTLAVPQERSFVALNYLPELLAILFRQLHYSGAYEFADSDEEEAEEEILRRSIRKVFLKAVRICPELTLRFVCSVLGEVLQQGVPLSALPFQRAEAALRLPAARVLCQLPCLL